jgi:hypothetical protein
LTPTVYTNNASSAIDIFGFNTCECFADDFLLESPLPAVPSDEERIDADPAVYELGAASWRADEEAPATFSW